MIKSAVIILSVFSMIISIPLFLYAEDLNLTGSLASGVYTSDGVISTQGQCQVNVGNSVTFEASSIRLSNGFRAFAGSSFKALTLDGDGLSNACELQYFGHLDYGPDDDIDSDGLTNLQECVLGTDPNSSNSDNDADGLPDDWEIRYAGLNLDTLNGCNGDADNDGISNWIEYTLGTSPTTANTNGPGIYYQYDELGRILKIERIPSR